MADRTRRTRRKRVRVKVEEPEVVEEVEEVEDDVEDEEVVEKPRRSRRERTVVKAEVEESEDDEEEEVEPFDNEELPDDEEPDVDEDDEEESDVVATVVDNSFGDVLANLEFGTMYTITRVSDDEFTITQGEAKIHMSKGLVGKAYEEEVYDTGYTEFYADWKNLTYADKVKRAKKAGVKWDEHDDPRVELMSLTKAYRDKLGIYKYKPQYRSRAARAAVRG